MSFRPTTNLLNAACNAAVQTIDVGSTILIYTGAQPASPSSSATGTLLSTISLDTPTFFSASGGISSINTSPSVSGTVIASGTAGWFRILNSGGFAVMDGSIGTSGADMIVDNASLVSGGNIVIQSLTVTATAV